MKSVSSQKPALTGCASLRREEATATEQLLEAAGFQMRPADTPERLARLREMPALKLVTDTREGEPRYAYADPEVCRCLYVGGPKEYAEYRRLALQREVDTQLDSGGNWLGWDPW